MILTAEISIMGSTSRPSCSSLTNTSAMHVAAAKINSDLDSPYEQSSRFPQGPTSVYFVPAASTVAQEKAIFEKQRAARQKRRNEFQSTVTPPSPRKRTSPSPPNLTPLTLSAYRRPDAAIRLTDCDVSKLITDDYEWRVNRCSVCVLGRGASSVVRLAARKVDGTKVAVKCIPKHELVRDHRRRDEFRLLQQISHPNIVKLRDVYETPSDLYLVMDLAEGDLYSKIEETGGFPESSAKKIVFKMLEALRYLHDEVHIVHRDVKPENILLFDSGDDTDVKLTDFGLAKRIAPEIGPQLRDVQGNRTRAYSRVGSDFYTAPEVSAGYGYDTAVDLYSLGVCAYILLIGSPPSSASTTGSEQPKFPEATRWRDISVEAKDFIGKLLSFDPKDRPTASEALQHEWFKTGEGICGGLNFEEKVILHPLWPRSKSDASLESASRKQDFMNADLPRSRSDPSSNCCQTPVANLVEAAATILVKHQNALSLRMPTRFPYDNVNSLFDDEINRFQVPQVTPR